MPLIFRASPFVALCADTPVARRRSGSVHPYGGSPDASGLTSRTGAAAGLQLRQIRARLRNGCKARAYGQVHLPVGSSVDLTFEFRTQPKGTGSPSPVQARSTKGKERANKMLYRGLERT